MLRISSSLSLSLALSLAACAEEADSPSDLSAYGVAAVERDQNMGFTLLDRSGAEVGTVNATPDSIDATLHDRSASLTWDATAGTVSCNGRSYVVAEAGPLGWSLVSPPSATVDDCADTLYVAEFLAASAGVTLPWRDNPVTVSQFEEIALDSGGSGGCVSTWSFGSSCSSCYSAACRADRGSRPCAIELGTQSCDSGALYTTCSVCFQL